MTAAEPPRPESDPWTRALVVVLLRAGLGINLLNSGLVTYISSRNGLMVGANTLLPQLQIGLGLALILGLFTAPAAVASGLLAALHPLITTAMMMGGGFNPGARGPFALQTILNSAESTSQLLLAAAVLWLATPGYNRWSLDSQLFPKRSPRRTAANAPDGSAQDDPPRAPPAGERTANFLANREK